MALPDLKAVQADPQARALIVQADAQLKALGYTEHGLRHVNLVARIARNVLLHLGHDEREAELAAIAGYLHDIGNAVHREHHAAMGALLAREILAGLGFPWEEIGIVMGAIGNHEEERGDPIHAVAAALILADKSDVHRSRVHNPNPATFDIHDRVNFAATRSFLRADAADRLISLELTIDTEIATPMEYFEIFLSRMVMCRRAARALGCDFHLIVNGVRLG